MIWADLMHIRGTQFFHHWLKMGRSRNWHDLRSPISKIRNIQIVDTYALTEHCEFQSVRITGVPLARCQTSKNATWCQVTYCDLVTWPLGSSGRRFLEMCQIVGGTVMANLAALRAAVYSLSAKNLTGGLKSTPPPVRGLNICDNAKG